MLPGEPAFATLTLHPLPSEHDCRMTISTGLSEEDLRPKIDPETGIDLSLIEENLRLTPWERMQANDDVLNLGEMLQEAVKRAHASA